MTPERWRQIRDVLDAALDVSPHEREAWLEQRCAGDEELRTEVESLLDSHDEGGDLLDTHAVGQSAAAVMRALDDIQAGRRIGPYLIVEEIGRGGMGAVFRAIRADDEFRRQVAIKIVKRGMDTDYILRRFQNERQILANFDHPNIAKLYDGGSTPDGLPYFVMEYIPGKPLDEYCDQNKLDVRARLELVRQVCLAVQYAHDNNVIHRDIKPGNILVTTDRCPKLLDFGIAKVIRPEGTIADSTATAFQLMTPEFASPEQVKGERITHSTDIYSLGVLLYRLLTGHGPYRLTTRTPQSMSRAIVEAEPSRPSDIVRITEPILGPDGEVKRTVTPEDVTTARGADLPRLRRTLSGDLDNIVLKAICKEPARRYASAAEFSEDLRRYLEGLPVTARRPTTAYRTTKWVRRNPAWAFVCLISLLAIATVVASWRGMMPSPTASDPKFRPAVAVLGLRNLSGNPDTAWLGETFAELLTTELSAGGALRVVPADEMDTIRQDMNLAPGDGLSRAALNRIRDRAGRCLLITGSYFAASKGPEAPLRIDFRLIDAGSGEVLTTLQESGYQRDLLSIVAKAGAKLRAKAGGTEVAPDDTRLRASQPANSEAARLYSEGMAAFRGYRTTEARDLLEKAVEADPRHASSYSALATALSSLGYDAKARAMAKRSFELSKDLPREEALFIEGRYREVTRNWPAAVEIYKTLWGFFPDNLEYGLRLAAVQIPAGRPNDALATVAALRKFPAPLNEDPRIDLGEADAQMAMPDYQKAELAAARAIQKGLAENSLFLLARAELADARALAGLGHSDRALERINEATAIYSRSGHRRGVAYATSELANVLDSRGDVEGARDAYERALAVYREIENKSGIATTLNNLGVLYHKSGDFTRAIAYHKQVLDMRREVEDRSGAALALGNIANALLEQGELAAAQKNYEDSLAIYRQMGQQRSVARVLTSLGIVARERGELAKANDLIEEALAIRRQVGDTSGGVRAQYYRGLLLYDNGDYAQARSEFQAALDSRRKQGDREWIATTLEGLGLTLAAQDSLPQARKALEECLSIRRSLNDRVDMAHAQRAMAQLLLAEKRYAEAERYAADAMAEFEREHAMLDQAEALVLMARAAKNQDRKDDAKRMLARADQIASARGAGRLQSVISHTRSGINY